MKRLVFGTLSTLLLAVGFVRAADHFDPINNDLSRNSNLPLNGSPGCGAECGSICDSITNKN